MIDEAVKHFKKGAVIIFPTDTVYGIGCDIRKKKSIGTLYKIRKDSPSRPMLILASDTNQAAKYGFFDSIAKIFVNNFWPGPLTVIVRATSQTPKSIQGKYGTVGIRVPNQPAVLKIIKKLGAPIVAPSANFHGKETPSSFAEIDKGILALVDYAVDLRNLEGSVKMAKRPSTVVDMTQEPFSVLRLGSISKQKIQKAWKEFSK